MNLVSRILAAASDLAAYVANALRWLPPSVARLSVGWVFFQSGWGKLHDLASVTEFFASLGLPAPAFQAVLASTAEFVCGAMLLLGVATRFAAVPLIITMIVAIRTALWSQVESVDSLFGLIEFLYIALLLWLATEGAGPLSLDRLFDRRRRSTSESAVIGERASSAHA